MMKNEYCSVPPAGWHCSREAGHEGPCAARNDYDWSQYVSSIPLAGVVYPQGEEKTTLRDRMRRAFKK